MYSLLRSPSKNPWPSEKLGIYKGECPSVLSFSIFSFSYMHQKKESMCLFLHFFTMKFSVSFGLMLSCILPLDALRGGKRRLSLVSPSCYSENSLPLHWLCHTDGLERHGGKKKKSKAHRKCLKGLRKIALDMGRVWA